MSQDLSIYIHYPFCKSKCPYCDFNSHVNKQVDFDKFSLAYENELEFFAGKLKNRNIKTIFFGGGTPSLMPVELVDRILKKISDLFDVDSNIEISLEANPTSFESEKFKDFRKSGINRLSMGIQALNDNDLKFLGREHSALEAINAISQASNIFENYSFDLIYARADQELKKWKEELEYAIKLSPKHLSLYQLTIEKGTPFYSSFNKGEFSIPEDELAADFYEITNEICDKNGLSLYEISNYANLGNECQHNLAYWQSKDYLGIGAGAHSRVYFDEEDQRSQMMNFHEPNKWQNSILDDGNAIQQLERTSQSELLEEVLIMGLRLKNGISNDILIKHFNKEYQELIELDKLIQLIDMGFVETSKNDIKITNKGRILTNSIIDMICAKCLFL